jgi:HlyD family secretion protein
MKLPRRLVLAAGATLLAGVTAACGLLAYNGPIGTVQKGMVSKSTVALGSLSAGPVAIIPFDQPDAKLIKVGEPAILTFEAVPGLQVIGTIQAIVPIQSNIVQKTIYQATIGVSGNDPRMKPGQNVRASVATFSVPNVLVVPNAAVHAEDSGSYVTAANGDRVQFTPGAVGDDVTEVRGGLTDGQQVRLK